MSLTLYPLGAYIQLLQRKNLQLEFSGACLLYTSPRGKRFFPLDSLLW